MKKNILKKWWFWVIVIVIIAAVGSSNNPENDNSNTNKSPETVKTDSKSVEVSKKEVIVIDFSKMKEEEIQEWCVANNIKCKITENYSNTVKTGEFVSQSVQAGESIYEGDTVTIIYSLGIEPTKEQKNALKKAESYSNTMHMSKKGIYEQLTSEYGENFEADAAQYAIDNIKADWNLNALEKAKNYRDTMSMSKKAIYEQLISSYGEKFTKDQAQYAIDHLDD